MPRRSGQPGRAIGPQGLKGGRRHDRLWLRQARAHRGGGTDRHRPGEAAQGGAHRRASLRQGAALRGRRQGRGQPLDRTRRAQEDENAVRGRGARGRAIGPDTGQRSFRLLRAGVVIDRVFRLRGPHHPGCRGTPGACARVPAPQEELASQARCHPQWYKHRHGVRTRALSGAARVARFRPPGARKAP